MEKTKPKIGDGIRVLVDHPNYTTCLKGDLLIIDDFTPRGNWVTKGGWHFGKFNVDAGLVEIVPASELPEGHVEIRHDAGKALSLALEKDKLTEKSLDAAIFYIDQKYKDAPIDIKTAAFNACAHGFYMGYRESEKQQGLFPKGVTSNDKSIRTA